MLTSSAGASGTAVPLGTFPVKSLLWFLAGAAGLRVLAMTGWGFFPPGQGLVANLARVIIPLLSLVGLYFLNRRLLARDGFPGDLLGLGWRKLPWFFAGAAVMVPIVGLLAGGLWLAVPFHYEAGTMTWSRFAWQAAEYFAGNSGEELMFRGYLLLLLTRHLGLNRALLVVGFLFGVFHLPGLSGWVAVKMICTTMAWSYLFAYGFLLTGSLWTALGMHMAGNVMLHHVAGLSNQPSLLRAVMHEAWPINYDPAIVVWFAVTLPILGFAALRIRRNPAAAI